jgi:hypothetical protein
MKDSKIVLNKSKLQINFKVTNSTNNKLENFKDNFDPEIFELVVILNNLGFRTFASCQGHVKEIGAPDFCPYIVFCHEDCDNIYAEGNSDKITKEFVYNQYSMIINEEKRLLEYLNEFYNNRNTIMRNRLVIHTHNFLRFSLTTSFRDFIKNITDIKEQEKLNKIYLNEVHDFTKFLESKYP